MKPHLENAAGIRSKYRVSSAVLDGLQPRSWCSMLPYNVSLEILRFPQHSVTVKYLELINLSL